MAGLNTFEPLNAFLKTPQTPVSNFLHFRCLQSFSRVVMVVCLFCLPGSFPKSSRRFGPSTTGIIRAPSPSRSSSR